VIAGVAVDPVLIELVLALGGLCRGQGDDGRAGAPDRSVPEHLAAKAVALVHHRRQPPEGLHLAVGVGLVGHGSNIMLLISGTGRGVAPVIGTADPSEFADPLPQALALTSIVITFGVTAVLLALGYRSWRITHDDVVEDDVEDEFIARRRDRDRVVEEQALAEREQAQEEDRR
jgi:multicomponent Na+:H+ antiporter subunit C